MTFGLDFALIADLRYPGERESERSPWPEGWVERIIAHDGERDAAAPHMALYEAGALGPEAIDQFYARFYNEMPFDPLYRPFGKNPRELHEALLARHSPLIEWSYLRFVNLSLLQGSSPGKMARYGRARPTR